MVSNNNIGNINNPAIAAKVGEVKSAGKATMDGTSALDSLDAQVVAIPGKSSGAALSSQVIEASKTLVA